MEPGDKSGTETAVRKRRRTPLALALDGAALVLFALPFVLRLFPGLPSDYGLRSPLLPVSAQILFFAGARFIRLLPTIPGGLWLAGVAIWLIYTFLYVL